MNYTISIRDAAAADLTAIVDIYNQSIPSRLATADLEPISVESRLSWYRDRQINRPLWVAEIDNLVVAWLSFGLFYGRPAYRHTAEISIYVANEYQGKGIGSSLLQNAIDRCPELGIKTLLAFVFAHNRSSLRLFTRYGFAAWGNLPQVAELDAVERDLTILGLRVY
jgi:L-amino acid N-acyltransferase YncA